MWDNIFGLIGCSEHMGSQIAKPTWISADVSALVQVGFYYGQICQIDRARNLKNLRIKAMNKRISKIDADFPMKANEYALRAL